MSSLGGRGPALPSRCSPWGEPVPAPGNLSGKLARPQVHRQRAAPPKGPSSLACGPCGRASQAGESRGVASGSRTFPGRSLGAVTGERDDKDARRSPRGAASEARAQCAPAPEFT
jgi:hypothetical protein